MSAAVYRPSLTCFGVTALLVVAFATRGAAGEAAPITQQIQLQPPRSESTIRVVTLGENGEPSAAGHELLAQMVRDGWRTINMTNITAANETTTKLAVLFIRSLPPPPQPVANNPPPGAPQPSAHLAGADPEGLAAKALLDTARSAQMQATASGLRYRVIKPGTGRKPTAADTVKVRYTGCKMDGTVFDASSRHGGTAEFPLANVIKGWTEGLQLMQEGGITHFVIPSELAYGKAGPPNIGPDQTLLFEVELISIK